MGADHSAQARANQEHFLAGRLTRRQRLYSARGMDVRYSGTDRGEENLIIVECAMHRYGADGDVTASFAGHVLPER